MIECRIFSACDVHQRALATNAQGQLSASQDWRSDGSNLIWQVKQGFLGQRPYGMAIIHKDTNRCLRLANNSKGSAIDLVENNESFDEWSTWTFGGDARFEGVWGRRANPIVEGPLLEFGFSAVRPYGNVDLNLNVKGGCGNSEVCAWTWGGGDRNEFWHLVPTGVQSSEYYRIQSRCDGWLGFDRARNTIGIIPYDADATLWKLDLGFSGGGIWGAGAATGCIMINNLSGLKFAFTDQAYYDRGGLHFTSDPVYPCTVEFVQHGDWTAIIRKSDGGPDCLDVSGGCGSSDVGFYAWNGGQNQQWLFHSMSEK
jgi:hypothetical protein